MQRVCKATVTTRAGGVLSSTPNDIPVGPLLLADSRRARFEKDDSDDDSNDEAAPLRSGQRQRGLGLFHEGGGKTEGESPSPYRGERKDTRPADGSVGKRRSNHRVSLISPA
jgi:hypothetical protein